MLLICLNSKISMFIIFEKSALKFVINTEFPLSVANLCFVKILTVCYPVAKALVDDAGLLSG